jgi:7-keto-8-aminopelargonate synthetase and related enzymes
MNLLEGKMSKYDAPQKFKALGIYPYFREIESDQDTEVTINGKRVLMFGSNAYLGLTNHPKVKEAAINAVKKYGTGMAGSRFLNGTLDIHVELEKKIAKFMGKEDAIVYPAGLMVNVGVVSCVTGREDYIIWDELNHASLIEGQRLSFSQKLKYKHNDMESLEKQLEKCDPDKIKLIVMDTVFSMEGDVANLPEIVRLAKKYNANIMADEAHGIGVFGKQGKGVCDHYGVSDSVDLVMGTFSKSLASIGGFIAASEAITNYLRHNSRTYIFSASNTPAATAAASVAFDIMINEPERIENLWKLTEYALNGFRSIGCEIGNTSTPIIPIYIRNDEKTFLATKMLFEEGIFINPVVSPAVSPEQSLIRFSLMATHTTQQIDYAIDKMEKILKKVGVLQPQAVYGL